jgi:hypothetical protein
MTKSRDNYCSSRRQQQIKSILWHQIIFNVISLQKIKIPNDNETQRQDQVVSRLYQVLAYEDDWQFYYNPYIKHHQVRNYYLYVQ